MATQITTTTSWGSRIMGSIKGVLFGLVLFLLSFVVLWLNEGRAVQTMRSLEEGAGIVVSLPSPDIKSENEGKLVHLSGKAVQQETVSDNTFGINLAALRLSRSVEMFQWIENKKSETQKKIGGSEETVTTYTYETKWSGSTVNSSEFKEADSHINPTGMPYESETFTATAKLGDFQLSSGQVSRIGGFTTLNPDSVKLPQGATVASSYVYIGKGSLTNPTVGDVRIKFEAVYPTDISVIAQQSGNSLIPYQTKEGDQLDILQNGVASAKAMFADAQSTNTSITWLIRAGGFLMMFMGLTMFFKPFVVIADVLPILGSLLSTGVGLFAGIIAFCLSFITIAIAWIVYRPILGISLLVVAIAVIVWFYRRSKKKKLEKQAQASAPVATS